ncbi:MAG TPA: cupin domain-containing protein [Hanamia sp.]|nr:cupin domain-containing protein [Hanamia sp.]
MARISKDESEVKKSKVHIIVSLIEYVPNAIVSRTVLKKTTGNITLMSFDRGEELAEKSSPFDTFVQVIDGDAEIIINKKNHILKLGEGITIPAHTYNYIKANRRFKIIQTVIKSGYEV